MTRIEFQRAHRAAEQARSRSGSPRLSAGVAVVRRLEREWRFLMLRAYRNWDFPKGLVEPEETPLAAACREVAEESGITDLRFTWGEVFCETPPYAANKIARYYVAETSTEKAILAVQPSLGRPEHHEWRWLTVGEALSLAVPRIQVVVKWAAGVIAGAPRP